MPNDDPRLRASDDDRDRTASLLREHHAAGRLTVDEFTERLDATYAAKTLGDLQALTADLPSIDLYRLPEQDMRRAAAATQAQASQPAPPQHGRLSPHWRSAWGSWASVSLVLFVIWLLGAVSSHHLAGLWFLWVAGPWGALLAGRWLFGGSPSGQQRPSITRTGDDPAPSPGPDRDALRQERFDEHMRRREEHLRHRGERAQRHADRIRRRYDAE